MAKLNVVLLEPEIPQNTGNISRTCAATGISLHMIEPFGFEITDAKLKRAGLDYWQYLDVHYYKNIEEFYQKNEGGHFFYFSTKAPKCYTQVSYPENSYLIFGKESAGIPEEILKNNLDKCEYLIPEVLGDMVKKGLATCDIIKTSAVWQGVTYKEDKEKVVYEIQKLVDNGVYPENLWRK